MSSRKSVLFVCLGNTCRSPIAEAVFLHQITQNNTLNDWKVDSAGIGGWFVGNLANIRTRNTLQNHNVPYNGRSRQITDEDFDSFEYIFGMDDDNIDDLKSLAPKGSKAKIELLGDYDPEGQRIIRDPYFDSGSEGFEKCFQQCMRCCKAFLTSI